jgi:hypothetical protein
LINDVRDLKIVDNAINGNRGCGRHLPAGWATYEPCRHGNGLSIEANGRVEEPALGRQRLPAELQQRRLHR